MRQVIKHRDIRLLNMIRRTDPVIPNSPHLRKPANIQGGSHDQNREWEVGHNTRYNDIDDEHQLKR